MGLQGKQQFCPEYSFEKLRIKEMKDQPECDNLLKVSEGYMVKNIKYCT